MSLLQLPNEVAFLILRYLPHRDLISLAAVNKKFHRLSQESSLWRRITLDARAVMWKERCVRKLLSRCPNLTSVVIKDRLGYGLSRQILRVLGEAKDSLQNLQLADSLNHWSTDDMQALSMMSKLQSLHISILNVDASNSLESIAHLTGLRVLVLRLMNFSLATAPHLLALNHVFKCLTNLLYVDVNPIGNLNIRVLAAYNPNIETLNIHRFWVSDETLQALISCCPKLEVLRIMHMPDTLEMVCSLANLKKLHITGDNTCGDLILSRLVESNPNLEELHMCGGRSPYITPSGIASMITKSQTIRKIEFFHYSSHIEDEDKKNLQEMFPMVTINFD